MLIPNPPQSWSIYSAFPIWWRHCLDDYVKASVQAWLALQSFSSGSFWSLDPCSPFASPSPPAPTCPVLKVVRTGSRGPMQRAELSSAPGISSQCTLLNLCSCLVGKGIPHPTHLVTWSLFSVVWSLTTHSHFPTGFLWHLTPFSCQWRSY